MRQPTLHSAVFLILIVLFSSCKKETGTPEVKEIPGINKLIQSYNGITPYKFERINENNFYSQGWKEQQVNIAGTTIFSDQSNYVDIVCAPPNNTDKRLIQGAVSMDLPTSSDPTLRRVRLRRGGYSGTRLADLMELKYSTYVIWNAPTIMVLQVDINNDAEKDFNIFFSPTPRYQGNTFPAVVLNQWQQWDALHGSWHIEAGYLPEFPDNEVTIQELLALPQYANARIIDTNPVGHNGEGVRFTIGGNPRSEYDNTVGFFDALIIGTKDKQHSMLFDFTCSHSNH